MAVRVIYIIPDHPHGKPWHEARQRATEALEDIQWFYADEMEKCGCGQKTFDMATDESGQIVFHQINSRLPPKAFTKPGGSKFMDLCNEEARREGLLNLNYRRVFFVEAYFVTNGVVSGARAFGSNARGGAFPSSLHLKLARREWLDNCDSYVGAILDGVSDQPLRPWHGRGTEYGDLAGAGFGAIAHELAHSFGLSEDRIDTHNRRGSLTGNGWRGMRGYFRRNLTQDCCVLRQYDADLLNSNKFFAIRTLKPKSGDFSSCDA